MTAVDTERFWEGRRALITGAAGFVGSWLTDTLADSGAQVFALVWPPAAESQRGTALNRAGVDIVEGSVEDATGIERLVRSAAVDTVFHLAAVNVNIGTSVSPFVIFETNIRGTYSVLEACRLNPRVERVVVASSKEADDRPGPGPFEPAASRRKRHPYQVSKVSAELVAQAYCDTSGVPVAIARCDNIYGGRDLNWNRLIPGTIRSLLDGQAPMLRSDGSLERDYVYVEDMVRAYLALAARLNDPAVRGGVFHFATGVSASVLSVVTRLSELVGRPDLKPVVLNESAGERVDEARSTERERATLGWESRVDLARGLALTVDWYRKYFGRGSAVSGR